MKRLLGASGTLSVGGTTGTGGSLAPVLTLPLTPTTILRIEHIGLTFAASTSGDLTLHAAWVELAGFLEVGATALSALQQSDNSAFAALGPATLPVLMNGSTGLVYVFSVPDLVESDWDSDSFQGGLVLRPAASVVNSNAAARVLSFAMTCVYDILPRPGSYGTYQSH